MGYYFGNMDTDSLEKLAAEVYKELHNRVILNISNYPVPVLTGDKLRDIMEYRRRHNYNLSTAKTIVEHYM